MSSGPTIEQFEVNLSNILSNNNDLRQQAERNYNNLLKQNCNVCVNFLLRILRNSKNVDARSMASVLLRKSIDWAGPKSVWDKLNPQVREFVTKNLIQILKHENDPGVRSKIRYCVANFISGMAKKNEPIGYMPEVLRWGMGDNNMLIEDALFIIQYLCTFLDDKVKRFLQSLKPMLAKGLKHKSNRIQTASLRTACCVISSSIGKNNRKQFTPVIPLMLSVLSNALNQKDFETAKTCIECFIEIAIEEPIFFKQHIAKVIFAMFTIAGAPGNIDEELRQLGMEFINTFSETAPTIAKSVPNLVENVFPLCMKYMLCITYDAQTFNSKYEDDVELSSYDIGIETLDRLSKALGGEKMSAVVFKTVPQYINDQENWKSRMIGLMAICQCAEGCKTYFRSHVENMMKMILQLFSDDHPRVRFAAIQTMAQLSSDFAPDDFLGKYHKRIFPRVLKLLEDPSPKVRSHAATSIINIIENGDKKSDKYILPYLDRILYLLVNKLLKTKIRYVQNQALAAITVLISRTDQFFKKYYGSMMPLLLDILKSTHIVNDQILRARAIECIGVLAVAVGKEMFQPHKREVIELLKRTESSPLLKYENPQYNYAKSCWPKIAKVMGKEFVPLLDSVINPLMKLVNQKVEVHVSDIDDTVSKDPIQEEDGRAPSHIQMSENYDGYNTVQFRIKGVGEKKITVKTSVIQDQVMSIHLFRQYGKSLGCYFLPWVQRIARSVIPFLNEHVLEEIKDEIVKLVPVLLDVVINAVKANMCPAGNIRQLFEFIFQTCCVTLEEENELKNRIIYSIVYLCMERIHIRCISDTHMERFIVATKTNILFSLTARGVIEEEAKEEENEDRKKQMEDEIEEHNYFLSIIQEALGKIMKNHPFCIKLFFQRELHKIYFSLLDPKRMDPDDQKLGLCVFVDILEYGCSIIPPEINLVDRLFPAFVNYAGSKNPAIRQAAVYGLGAFARYGGIKFGSSHCRKAIGCLVKNIQHPDAKDVINSACHANAVSALYKFILYRSGNTPGVDSKSLSVIWLNALPVSGDVIESRVVHNCLLQLIAKNHPLIKEKFGFVMGVLRQIVNTDLVEKEDRVKIKKFLGSAVNLTTLPNIDNARSPDSSNGNISGNN